MYNMNYVNCCQSHPHSSTITI
uniref:Uncharacterized protein n=1 Tax=Anguilla anguilla TaxID=7936 RepID=A0A0E9RRH9_ANGAN